MTAIEKQIIESWCIHNGFMLKTIAAISEEALQSTLSTRGGRDVARQLAHLHNVRVWRLKAFAKKSTLKLTEFDKKESPCKEKLLEAFAQSGAAMEKYFGHCIEKGGVVPNFRRGVVPMLGYYISHEAHHRGNIFLTMKQSRIKIPDTLKWGIWEWNKEASESGQ